MYFGMVDNYVKIEMERKFIFVVFFVLFNFYFIFFM